MFSSVIPAGAQGEAIVSDGKCFVVNEDGIGGFGEIDITTGTIERYVSSDVEISMSVSVQDDEGYRQSQIDKHDEFEEPDFGSKSALPGKITLNLYAEWPSRSGDYRMDLDFRQSELDRFARFLHGHARIREQEWRVKVYIDGDFFTYRITSGNHHRWMGLQSSAATGFPYRGGETIEFVISDPDGPDLLTLKGQIPADLAGGINYALRNEKRLREICEASRDYVKSKGIIDTNPKKDDPRYAQVQELLRDIMAVGDLASQWKKDRFEPRPDLALKESFKRRGIPLLWRLDDFLKKNPDFVYALNDGVVHFTQERDALLKELKILINHDREPLNQSLALQVAEVPSSDKMPRLVELAANGSIEEASAELKRTGQPNANREGFTALAEAAKRGKTDMIRFLVDNGASVSWHSWRSSPLREAAINNKPETVKLLLELGAPVDLRSGDNLYTPLIEAAIKGNTDVVILLLAAGAYPNAVGIDGLRAIDHARRRNHSAVIKLLEPVSWK